MAVPEHLCPHRKIFPISRFSVFCLVTLMLMTYALTPMLFPCLNRAFISLVVYSKTEYSVFMHLLFQELCRCASTFLSSHKPCHQDRQPFSTCIQCQTSVTVLIHIWKQFSGGSLNYFCTTVHCAVQLCSLSHVVPF